MTELSSEEMQRYSRHFPLPEIGIAGQLKLKESRVLCIGAGGLGSPLLNYLTAAGVGTIGIMDHDSVDVTNLQRQTLFNITHIGINKATAAAMILKQLNPFVNFEIYDQKLTVENAVEIIKNYDIIAECTDSVAAKYLANDACFHLKKPLVYASISQFEGLCAILCIENTPCYRCIFPQPAPEHLIKNCADSGILGTTAGILGLIQANEVLKFILNIGTTLQNKLLSFNTLTLEIDILTTKQNPDCILCGAKIPFEKIAQHQESCVSVVSTQSNSNNENTQLSPQELKTLLEKEKVFLLDVRDPHEHQAFNIGGVNIPLAQLPQQLNILPKNDLIIVYCQAGIRSATAVQILKNAGFTRLKNLQGGMNQWINS